MKKLLILLILAIAAWFIYKNYFKAEKVEKVKPVPLAVSKHSEAFNISMIAILENYYALANGFVNWDTAVVNTKIVELQKSLNEFRAADLKVDTIIYQTAMLPWDNAKNNASVIGGAVNWEERRRAFRDLSENLQFLLITVKYDNDKVYWQECPMAFGDDQPANWLSKTEEVVNPYLGTKDPKYGNSMLHCGQTKMTIDFVAKDSTANP
ncbi:MAG TPA: hypothetical protein PK191_10130 [Niabella sp.]|nr:hypothetical protein [Niabella sp.]HOZ98224.1 hypothetical protein [Niabella sp.]HQW16265.1 hypothetical protein [Niabella sp.]HQX21448.1 hypothetical protein [Niabella sp.]HQX42733.1 hypothetical protein [Niabella sp.]